MLHDEKKVEKLNFPTGRETAKPMTDISIPTTAWL